ncbi:MAG: hypothetical protein ACR2MX_08065 [Cyclobacteriaceae bacterium]
MKKLLTSMICSILFLSVSGQQKDNNKGQLDMAPVAGGFVKEIKFIPKQTEGTHYLQDNWSVGKVMLFNGSALEDLQMKFDIEKSHLEIRTKGRTKLLQDTYIEEFTLLNTESGSEMKFMNGSLYKENGVASIGFFESILEGKLSLFSKTELDIIKANYDAKFDVGEKSDKVVKSENYFVANGKNVFRITKNKKENLKIFGDKSDLIYSYMKSEKLSFKNKEDLERIVVYYNSNI